LNSAYIQYYIPLQPAIYKFALILNLSSLQFHYTFMLYVNVG